MNNVLIKIIVIRSRVIINFCQQAAIFDIPRLELGRSGSIHCGQGVRAKERRKMEGESEKARSLSHFKNNSQISMIDQKLGGSGAY